VCGYYGAVTMAMMMLHRGGWTTEVDDGGESVKDERSTCEDKERIG